MPTIQIWAYFRINTKETAKNVLLRMRKYEYECHYVSVFWRMVTTVHEKYAFVHVFGRTYEGLRISLRMKIRFS